MNHDGNLYRIPYMKTVANSSWACVWIVSPSTTIEAHAYFKYTADNAGYIELWKSGVTSSSQFVEITPVQSNGFSTNAAQVVAYSGGVPTTSSGTLFRVQTIGSGGKSEAGGSGELTNEIILAPNSTYIIRFTCTSTEADVAFGITFYEES
jgi:hypothetical protein